MKQFISVGQLLEISKSDLFDLLRWNKNSGLYENFEFCEESHYTRAAVRLNVGYLISLLGDELRSISHPLEGFGITLRGQEPVKYRETELVDALWLAVKDLYLGEVENEERQ